MDKPTFKFYKGCWEITMSDGNSFRYVNGEMIKFKGNNKSKEKQFNTFTREETELIDRFTKKVICGKCGKEALKINIKTPQPISEWDKENNWTRDHAFNCCGRNWLIGENEPIDCGPSIEAKE